ncbi:hypothetical protein N7414_24800 [Pseudomonas sp. GD04087]|uniref:hypothetical protein n=1 Tax=unclassified Pseudomonas TaxID=196821 RepID=UPI002448ED18|nr:MULTISPECIES: hypothetical protein [unclassified Pseudomonas]MDH0292354.1 hypothetical protein [Pseudomonas sp. GD04087]MDH1048822.1 hypothetical protein [Pseudomonas sp. GD03903]MDH2001310.1 hypothetical protein [Pseudomonas sp. GD03691]
MKKLGRLINMLLVAAMGLCSSYILIRVAAYDDSWVATLVVMAPILLPITFAPAWLMWRGVRDRDGVSLLLICVLAAIKFALLSVPPDREMHPEQSMAVGGYWAVSFLLAGVVAAYYWFRRALKRHHVLREQELMEAAREKKNPDAQRPVVGLSGGDVELNALSPIPRRRAWRHRGFRSCRCPE